MTHVIVQLLPKLSPPLAANESLDVYFYGNHRPHPGSSPPVFIHAFCGGYARSSAPRSGLVTFNTWASAEDQATHMRAQLAGMLTALRWLTEIRAEQHKLKIYGKSFVAEHLPARLPIWCTENRSLLPVYKEFLPYFERGVWRYPDWNVVPLKNKDKPKTVHHRRLDALAKEVDRELQRRIYDELHARFPEIDLADLFPDAAVDDNEWKRALQRDRT